MLQFVIRNGVRESMVWDFKEYILLSSYRFHTRWKGLVGIFGNCAPLSFQSITNFNQLLRKNTICREYQWFYVVFMVCNRFSDAKISVNKWLARKLTRKMRMKCLKQMNSGFHCIENRTALFGYFSFCKNLQIYLFVQRWMQYVRLHNLIHSGMCINEMNFIH